MSKFFLGGMDQVRTSLPDHTRSSPTRLYARGGEHLVEGRADEPRTLVISAPAAAIKIPLAAGDPAKRSDEGFRRRA